jgi:alpha-methylacyl-CoA racemase
MTKTRDEWAALFATGDACVSPVLDMAECMTHPLAMDREMFMDAGGFKEPAPAPKFSRTPGSIKGPPRDPRQDTRGALQAWGFSSADIDVLASAGVIAKG